MRVIPDGGNMTWAVSQASPLRRIVVEGNLDLYQYIPPYPSAGYASGGYMSDSTVTGTINSGSQQQFFLRNLDIGVWTGGAWNMVFVGSKNAPPSHCGQQGGIPATTVNATPVIVEKPYVVSNGKNGYSLMIPRLEKNKVGATPGYENADEIPFD